jgi:hypothetical protein
LNVRLIVVGEFAAGAGGNTPVPALNPDNPAAAGKLGNVFFGAGAFVVPFLASFVFDRIGFLRAVAVFSAAAGDSGRRRFPPADSERF